MTISVPGYQLASFRIDNALIVVTGASERMGRAFAECFAHAGVFVVPTGRRKDMLHFVQR